MEIEESSLLEGNILTSARRRESQEDAAKGGRKQPKLIGPGRLLIRFSQVSMSDFTKNSDKGSCNPGPWQTLGWGPRVWHHKPDGLPWALQAPTHLDKTIALQPGCVHFTPCSGFARASRVQFVSCAAGSPGGGLWSVVRRCDSVTLTGGMVDKARGIGHYVIGSMSQTPKEEPPAPGQPRGSHPETLASLRRSREIGSWGTAAPHRPPFPAPLRPLVPAHSSSLGKSSGW